MNSQEVDLYVALPEGVYLYEAKPHQLRPMLNEDVRQMSGKQPFITNAPVVLIYIADLSRLTRAKPESRSCYADIATGCISENVYLFCASEGLATVIYDLDRGPLVKKLRLGPEQKIILAQAAGFPR